MKVSERLFYKKVSFTSFLMVPNILMNYINISGTVNDNQAPAKTNTYHNIQIFKHVLHDSKLTDTGIQINIFGKLMFLIYLHSEQIFAIVVQNIYSFIFHK